MDLKTNWNKIKDHFNKSLNSNFYVSVAFLNSENIPTVTPIGSLFLNDNQTGYYFEKFSSMLLIHIKPLLERIVTSLKTSDSVICKLFASPATVVGFSASAMYKLDKLSLGVLYRNQVKNKFENGDALDVSIEDYH